MKNKNGFTLIELLAVIIILGILMIIAIPSVTKYISDSRKNSYVDSAKEIIGSARNLVNSGELEMYDTDATYYIDVNCIKTENAMKSPYGDFTNAYVVVTFDGKGYNYYWTSVDEAGEGIKDIVRFDNLDADNIESDLSSDDISTVRTIDGRHKVILITERNDCRKEGAIDQGLIQINGETGEEKNSIEYPEGKDKSTVVVGDIVKIGEEEFYVVKHDGNDLVLLSHYNLKVGNIYNNNWTKAGEYTSSDTGYGRQSSDVKGIISGNSTWNGTVGFSNTNYWNGKVGTDYPGNYCTSISGTNCTYIYDSNSNLYQYVNNYKTYLESLGATIKSARLISIEEVNSFKDIAPIAYKETSYWLGSANNSNDVWFVTTNGLFYNNYGYSGENSHGVRPVIVI